MRTPPAGRSALPSLTHHARTPFLVRSTGPTGRGQKVRTSRRGGGERWRESRIRGPDGHGRVASTVMSVGSRHTTTLRPRRHGRPHGDVPRSAPAARARRRLDGRRGEKPTRCPAASRSVSELRRIDDHPAVAPLPDSRWGGGLGAAPTRLGSLEPLLVRSARPVDPGRGSARDEHPTSSAPAGGTSGPPCGERTGREGLPQFAICRRRAQFG